jgi:hypothetical protein
MTYFRMWQPHLEPLGFGVKERVVYGKPTELCRYKIAPVGLVILMISRHFGD